MSFRLCTHTNCNNKRVRGEYCKKHSGEEERRGQGQQGIKRNLGSTSVYVGVHYSFRFRKWIAKIRKDGNQLYIGSYDTPEEAAKAYNVKAVELYGVKAKLNEINDLSPAKA